MDATDYLDGVTVSVSEERYDVVKTDRAIPDAFATIEDDAETTAVVEADNYDAAHAIEVEPDWAILTFEAVLPFDLVGFLARVATALAEADISIFALSAYSTDHVLVKTEDIDVALETLADLGCDVPA